MTFSIVVLVVTILAFIVLELTARSRKKMAMKADPSKVVKWVMPVVVSLVVLGAALFIVLTARYGEGTEKFAFATIGTVVGYWLKSIG